MAIHDLDGVFGSLQRPVRIKRGRLLTWDDARTSDLIFVGSPYGNLSLRELPAGKQDFVFSRNTEGARKGDLMISNLEAWAGRTEKENLHGVGACSIGRGLCTGQADRGRLEPELPRTASGGNYHLLGRRLPSNSFAAPAAWRNCSLGWDPSNAAACRLSRVCCG